MKATSLPCLLPIVVLLMLLSGAHHSAAASFTFSGRIVSHRGAPLPGAVVTAKGSTTLATTNAAGFFLLSLDNANPVLLVSCQGYQSQTLTGRPQASLAITLYPIGVAPPLGEAATSNTLAVPDMQPTYPGGVAAYRTYLQQNVRYPEAAKAAQQSGDVFVSFVVDETGRILDAQVAKGCGYGLDEEALRLVRLMPWWTPGLLNGKPVKVPCTLRIRFDFQAQ